jgi:hypothetical protein
MRLHLLWSFLLLGAVVQGEDGAERTKRTKRTGGQEAAPAGCHIAFFPLFACPL